jgi:carboxyl-terminal processing protease
MHTPFELVRPLHLVHGGAAAALLAGATWLALGSAPSEARHAAPAAVAVQEQAELAGFVARQLDEARGDDPGVLWERALALRAAGQAFGGARLDAELDARLAAAIEPAAELLAIAARAQGEGADVPRLAERLLALVAGPNERVAAAAADLLAKRTFGSAFARPERLVLAGKLLASGQSADLPPRVRIAAALSAWSLGGGTEKRNGRDVLLAFLESTQPEVRGLAALALAATGEVVTGRLQIELSDLARLPGESGRLADAYLRLEDVRRLGESQRTQYERQLKQQVLPEELSRFEDVLDMVEKRHLDGARFPRERLIDAAMNGMLQLLDEHSTYLGPEAYAKFMGELEAEYGGIGAYVQIDPSDNLFTITRPIYSGPAYRAGLQSDDKIVRIGDWPTLGHPADEVIKRLKGEPGTPVELYIWRRGMDVDLIDRPTEEMRHVIERQIIHVPAVQSELLPGGVGQVELTTFSRGVGAELDVAVRDLVAKGATSIVLDLRRNSGGLLSEAVEVANVFLPRNLPVVHTEYRVGERQTLQTRRSATLPDDVQVAVLVSRFTASASEIVAGALQDHGRAVLIGKRTYGKGSVQNLLPLENSPEDRFTDTNDNGIFDAWEPIVVDHDGDGQFDFAPRVKLTIARYLLPSGRSIHRELDTDGTVLSEGGVEPDVDVDAETIEGWRYVERLRVRDELRVPRTYVDARWAEHRDLFAQLARTDRNDPSAWPDFDEVFASTPTTLSRDDLRDLLRQEVRRRVQDERGAAFPLGDFQEDLELQRAIQELAQRRSQDWRTVPEFAATFDDLDPEAKSQELLARISAENTLERLLDRLRAAKEAGVDPAEVAELIELIEKRAER